MNVSWGHYIQGLGTYDEYVTTLRIRVAAKRKKTEMRLRLWEKVGLLIQLGLSILTGVIVVVTIYIGWIK